MNRRQLLRTGSLGRLGLLASNSFPTALAQPRTAGANERLRLGIVGFSDRLNSALLPAFLSLADEMNCEIVSVADLWCPRRDDAKKWFTTHPFSPPRSGHRLLLRPSPPKQNPSRN